MNMPSRPKSLSGKQVCMLCSLLISPTFLCLYFAYFLGVSFWIGLLNSWIGLLIGIGCDWSREADCTLGQSVWTTWATDCAGAINER